MDYFPFPALHIYTQIGWYDKLKMDILYTQKFNIEKGDTLEKIRLKCQEATSEAFIKVVQDIKEHKHKPTKQNKEDGKQYFVMNPLLKEILIKRLESL